MIFRLLRVFLYRELLEDLDGHFVMRVIFGCIFFRAIHVILQVLEHVRLPLCSPPFLCGVVGDDVLVRMDARCRDLVDEAKNYMLLPQERSKMQGPRTRPRKPVKYGQVLYAGEGGF